jgi:hypothetical protein
MREPQEIPDQEYEQFLGRVAAVDVAKASGMVCTRMPHPERAGKRRTLVWEVPATTNAVLELGEHRSCCWRLPVAEVEEVAPGGAGSPAHPGREYLRS